MTDVSPSSSPAPSPNPLQFDSAEMGSTPIGVCQRCGGALGEAYYQVDDIVACDACATRRLQLWNSASFFKRAIGALFFGLIGAAIGFGIYCAVLVVAGIEIGLVAIVAGLAVGIGVKMGTGGRGGRVFQVLAVLLTYGAIAASYAAVAEREISKRAKEVASRTPSSAPSSAAVAGEKNPEDITPDEAQLFLSVPWVLRVAMLTPFAAAIPFLAFNPIGALIIAFALYEAWKIAGAAPPPVSGPFRRQVDAASATVPSVPLDADVRRS